MAGRSVRRSLSTTPEMRDRLAQLVSKQPRDVTEADLIREAIRLYLDNQEDIIGSRRHFQRSLQERLDRLEGALAFQLNVLIYLLAALEPVESAERIAEAILAAGRDGEQLLAQMQAVRAMKGRQR
jgi:Arc/MetJ-type ribon-helix-helix transcriptional regulator